MGRFMAGIHLRLLLPGRDVVGRQRYRAARHEAAALHRVPQGPRHGAGRRRQRTCMTNCSIVRAALNLSGAHASPQEPHRIVGLAAARTAP